MEGKMSPRVLGPLTGVILTVILTLFGVLIATTMGVSTSAGIVQVHVSAMTVLLVTIMVRLERKEK
jgi:hypothetical protein